MLKINSLNARVWSKLGTRGTFALAINELGGLIDNIKLVTADLGVLTGLTRFMENHPEKFFNVGIAEQNMIGVSAGMAKEGNVVFVTTYANFIAMRSYEQVRLNLGYMGLNVKLVGSGSGLVMGMSGNSHYGIEDLSLMRSIPGMVVLSPADGAETIKCVEAAAKYDGPVYIRLTGEMNNPIIYKEEYEFEIGKAVTIKKGTDITILATGTMVYESLIASKLLEKYSINASVVNIHTIKPLDTKVIKEACNTSKLIVTIEEHSIIGGLGGAVAEYKSTLEQSPKQLFIGLPDSFSKIGEYKYLLEKYGLTGEQIAQKILSTLRCE